MGGLPGTAGPKIPTETSARRLSDPVIGRPKAGRLRVLRALSFEQDISGIFWAFPAGWSAGNAFLFAVSSRFDMRPGRWASRVSPQVR